MSLINDALKRATKAQPATGKPDAASAPMQLADAHQSVGLPSYFVPVLLCVFCGAFWFIVRGWEARRQTGLYSAPVTIHAREIPAATVPAETAAPADEVNAIPENRNFSLNDEPVTAVSADASVALPATPAPPAAVPFRLQGIFYRPSDPSAVVNTKTVYVGDLISGGRVKAIDRQSVTIERDGQTQVLTLQ